MTLKRGCPGCAPRWSLSASSLLSSAGASAVLVVLVAPCNSSSQLIRQRCESLIHFSGCQTPLPRVLEERDGDAADDQEAVLRS